MTELVLASYAKINLGLYLIRKRVDGYHDIATVFQQVGLHDKMIFQKTDHDIQITCTNPEIPVDENNLVWKTFDAARSRFQIPFGLKVHIEKHIPAGGGLGGGSSNAAATLQVIQKFISGRISKDQLQELAAEIGSDVPFFLVGGTAFGSGRGEKLRPIQIPTDFWVVLLFPDIHVSTAWAYQHAKIALTNEEKLAKFRALFEQFSLHAFKDQLVNELESVVFERHPQLQELKSQLYEKGAFYAGMSGSGSTLYGLFRCSQTAEEAVSFFSSNQEVRALICKPISDASPFKTNDRLN
jgi:4-diphosphocytidyl-2-C-methyl-D-erythritol kinase